MRSWRPTGTSAGWIGRHGRSYRAVTVRFREPTGLDPRDSLDMAIALEKAAREIAPVIASRAKEIVLEERSRDDSQGSAC